jgi:serine/threonine protein kinase/tetratricopeptide (TPR) repeat protein/TolB-like protein
VGRPDSAPDRIDRYEVLERLGAGAFGTVYLARDPLLERRVVIKRLDRRPEEPVGFRDRLLDEARIASAVEHPNVCPVYEVGEHDGRPYIVMQYVPGETLEQHLAGGRLPLPFALSVGVQVADGLAAAHRLGILHRDLKPANIMIVDGTVKILDFGLARRRRPTGVPTPAGAGPDGEPGAPAALVAGDAAPSGAAADAAGPAAPSVDSMERFGTTAYMAPEQLAVGRSSEQSDIFSLGVILYRMLAGRHPFYAPGTDPAHLPAAIQRSRPVPPSELHGELPPALDDVVMRALAKQPANRFRYARDVAEALKAVMGSLGVQTGLLPGENAAVLPSPGPRRERGLLTELAERFLPPGPGRAPQGSIATIPFTDLDAPEGPRVYGFTLSHAVATRLSRVPDLTVRPLSAYLAVADPGREAVELGRELQAERVLVGGYTRQNGRLELDWQLLDVRTRAIRAGGSVELPSAELAVVQDRVAEEVFSVLRASGQLGGGTAEPASGTDLESLTAEVREDLLAARGLLAAFALRAGTVADLDRARAAYERVVESAPDFAPGHAGLGTVYLRSARNGFGGVEDLRAAERHLSRALALDPALVEARLYRASTMIWAGEKESARFDLQDLLRSAPPDADINLAAAVALQLDGLLDEALRLQSAALQLNPAVAPRVYYYRARVLLFQERWDPARRELDRGLAIEPDHALLRHVLGFLQLLQGDTGAAIATLEAVHADAPNLRIVHPTLAMAYVRAGRTADGMALIGEDLLDAASADAETAYRVATYLALIGDVPEALDWLRTAVYLGNENYPWIAANPIWRPLRDEPEMREILRALEEVYQMNRISWATALASLPAGS